VPIKVEGQVGITAFAPRYETGLGFAKHDRFIAADLGAALKALPAAKADHVLNALSEHNEPLILADMLRASSLRSVSERFHRATRALFFPSPKRRYASTGCSWRA
jgi:hypothetical protein